MNKLAEQGWEYFDKIDIYENSCYTVTLIFRQEFEKQS